MGCLPGRATHHPGISAKQLQRQLGLSRYETAWLILQKLRRAMVAPERELLKGEVEIDEFWLGGYEEGLKGSSRQRGKKALVGVAIEVRGAGSGHLRLTGSVLDHSQLVRRFKKALAAAGVRPVRFNDLRHTFGTRMAATGVPLRTLREWMGRRDIKTTLVYADYQPDDRRENELVERAFSRGPNSGPKLSETERTEPTSDRLTKPV